MLKALRIVLIILTLFAIFSCEPNLELIGNYNTCDRGLYGELYFKNDSMRMATSLEFVSDWRKYEIKNDSFYHYSFGEPEFRVAKITVLDADRFELFYPNDSVTHIFSKMDIDINFDRTHEQFFNAFNLRKVALKCLNEFEK